MLQNHLNFVKAIFLFFVLINLSYCKSTQVSLLEGEDAILIFPYPCNSTEVTLQKNTGAPFYRSRHGSSLSLPHDQFQRFMVQNRMENGNCFLDLTISVLMRNDRGTYFVFVYKAGEILNDDTQNIRLVVNYPPGKASCVVGEDKGGDWVATNCTANTGSLPGELECYQNGEWMPSLTTLSETSTSIQQTFLIRKSQPAFCCSSIWNEYKERCKCHDTGLYLSDDDDNDPCPDLSEITMHNLPITMENNQSHLHFNTTFSTPTIINNNTIIIWPILLFIALTITGFILNLIFFYKTKTKIKYRNDNCTENLHANLFNQENQPVKNSTDSEEGCKVGRKESHLGKHVEALHPRPSCPYTSIHPKSDSAIQYVINLSQ